ncbi:hypothetical protein HUU51_01720 [Candidatus Gracilibacteria bacterium]|nr:hypothetical protein [Candidatus Gracilibacteria bacterium]
MGKQQIKVDGKVLDKIASSEIMTESEKLSFMKYVGYMTNSEQKELVEII